MNEREMIIELMEARDKVTEIEETLKEAKQKRDKVEYRLIEYLTEKGATRTSRYEGVGSASISEKGGRLFARYDVEDFDKVEAWLNDNGLGDLVKPTVHRSSLSSVVGEKLQNGEQVPEFIKYYFKQSVRVIPTGG